jgi:hypothetical protein
MRFKIRSIRAALLTGPSASAEILAVLPHGDIVTFEGERKDDWIKVSVDGRAITGWIREADCEATGLSIRELAETRRQASADAVGDRELPAPVQTSADEDAAEDDSRLDDMMVDRLSDDGPSRDEDFSFRKSSTRHSDSDFSQSDSMPERAPPRTTPSRMKPSTKRAPPKAAPEPTADVVDASVFGPETVQPGGECLIQVFLHRLEQAATVDARARETDPDAKRRGVKTLAAEIRRGATVQVIFDGRGLTADQAVQSLVWRGDPDTCQFIVSVPAGATDKTYYPRILLLLDSVPVGAVTFALRATAGAQASADVGIRGDQARRYSYAFLSYASPDRGEVLKRAQGLRAARIDFFQDLLSLEPGDRWEKKLYEQIDRCDLFVLFWSSQAKASPWVMKELEYALARQKKPGEALPDIAPVILEGPPPPSPPDTMQDIHFNDSLIYMMEAVAAHPTKPRPV